MDGDFPSTDTAAPSPERLRLLGGEVDLVTAEEVLDFTAARVRAGVKAIVANHNLHSLHLIRRDPAMRRLYAMADLIEADSMPLIAWGRLLGRPIAGRHRCTYLDWREAFWRRAADGGWRVFYLGGAPGVAATAAEALGRRYPGACIATRDGYFDPAPDSADNAAVIAAINAFRPDVLFVGMGMPRQEGWIADAFARLDGGVVFPVGAAFDYEAGVQSAAPRWSGPLGLEWLFRFAADPGRLFRRYFIEPWSLLGPALADLGAQQNAPERTPGR